MTEITSTVICQKTSEEFAVQFEEQYGTWIAMRAWKPEDSGTNELNGEERTTATGGIGTHHSYEGCPYCGKAQFFKCFTCESLSCYNGYSNTAHCHVCEKKIQISGDIDEIAGSEQSNSITESSSTTDITRE